MEMTKGTNQVTKYRHYTDEKKLCELLNDYLKLYLLPRGVGETLKVKTTNFHNINYRTDKNSSC